MEQEYIMKHSKKELKSHLLEYGQSTTLYGTKAMMSKQPKYVPYVYRNK